MDKKFDPINWCNKMFGETAETRENLTKLLKDKIRAEGLDEAVRILVGDGSVESVDLFHLKILRAGGFTIDRSMSVLTNFLEILTTRLRLIHTLCVWHMRLRQKCAVQKNRKFPISVETQPSATAACVKRSSCESTFKNRFVTLEPVTVGGRITEWIVSSLTRIELTKKRKYDVICMLRCSYTCKPGDQPYSDTSPLLEPMSKANHLSK